MKRLTGRKEETKDTEREEEKREGGLDWDSLHLLLQELPQV